MASLLLDGLTLINDGGGGEQRRAKIRAEGWHWYSRPDVGELDSGRAVGLRKSPRAALLIRKRVGPLRITIRQKVCARLRVCVCVPGDTLTI